MTLEEARDLLPLYALDALLPEEARGLEPALRAYPELQAELLALQSTAAELVASLPTEPIPQGLEAKVMASLPSRTEESQPKVLPLPTQVSTRPPSPLRWLAPAIAAAALVVLAWTGSLAWGWIQALGNPSSKIVTLVNDQGGVVGRALVRPDRRTLLVVNLPPPAGGKVYQAWGLGAGQPIPLNTFTRQIAVLELPPQATALAVSEEPAGGSRTPTQIRGLPQN
ncbi:MAG: anti-sigma factor [Meiothermus sp.]